METQYPFTLDRPLKEALNIAMEKNDKLMIKKLWDLFISYRKNRGGEKWRKNCQD
jgi:hypothetical protein